MKKLLLSVMYIVCFAICVKAASPDCGFYSDEMYHLLDREYKEVWEKLCNQYAYKLSGEDRNNWQYYRDTELWHDFVAHHASLFCNSQYITAADTKMMKKNKEDIEFFDLIDYKFNHPTGGSRAKQEYIAAYRHWKQNKPVNDATLKNMPRIECSSEYRQAAEKLVQVSLLSNTELNEMSDEEKQLMVESTIIQCQSSDLTAEDIKAYADNMICQMHIGTIFHKLVLNDAEPIDATFDALFAKYKNHPQHIPDQRAEAPSVAYERAIWRSILLNSGNEWIGAYQNKIKMFVFYMLPNMQECKADTSTVSDMLLDYFVSEQMPKDFAHAILPSYKDNISIDELEYVIDSIYSDETYKRINDFVNSAGLKTAGLSTKSYVGIEAIDTSSVYWEQKEAVYQLVNKFLTSLFTGAFEQADIVCKQEYMSKMNQLFEGEWSDAYLAYFRTLGVSDLIFPKYVSTLQLVKARNPQAMENITQEQFMQLFRDYCLIYVGPVAPEYYCVASTQDLKYMSNLISIPQFKKYITANINLSEKQSAFHEDGSFLCDITTSIYYYLASHYTNQPNEIQFFKKLKKEITATYQK